MNIGTWTTALRFWWVWSLPLVIAIGCVSASGAGETSPTPGVAVVELFTSEGCSSCPAADDVLGKLVAGAKDKPQPVYAIAFHVDYWNRLGWADRFSTRAATERQHTYAKAFHSDNVYTPQMVVNGSAEFVGSREAQAHEEIAKVLSRPATSRVVLTAATFVDGKLRVHYAVDGVDRPSSLHLVAVVDEATTEVRRGENGGRTLRHANVAVGLDTRQISGKADGDATLALSSDQKPTRVIAFIQQQGDMAVTGAGAVDVVTPN